jgi:hypothetical protein
LGLPCENSWSEPAGGGRSAGWLQPHKTTWKKTTLIALHVRGIRSGDAIIRDDGEVIIRRRWIYTPLKEVRDGTREELIAKFEACISDFSGLSSRWAYVLNHRNTLRFILRRTRTGSIFMNTTDEVNGRKSAPIETLQLFAADDTLNRELDAVRQLHYRNCEPDLEYVHAEFERVCLAEIQAAISGVIRSA